MRKLKKLRRAAAAVLCACLVCGTVGSYYTGPTVTEAKEGEKADVPFTIQTYINFESVKKGSGDLSFLNTESGNLSQDKPYEAQQSSYGKGGKLPQNGASNKMIKVGFDSSGKIQTESKTVQLFMDEKTSYVKDPQIEYMSRLYNKNEYNPNYTMSEVWVCQPGAGELDSDGYMKDASGLTDGSFVVYKVPMSSDGKTHDPSKIRFTNNPANSNLTVNEGVSGKGLSDVTTTVNGQKVVKEAIDGSTAKYPYKYTILIQKGTIVRFLYDTTSGETRQMADFYDYDISDGYIYSTFANSKAQTSRKETSTQTNTSTFYAHTRESGINSAENYTGSGTKYAFGNSNAGTNRGAETWNGNTPNKYNNSNRSNGSNGCTFGLATGLDLSAGEVVPQWGSGLDVPAIFGSEDITGKTKLSGYSLNFLRTGSTYTLSSVLNNGKSSVSGLDQFKNTYLKSDGSDYSSSTKIYGNSFWPLDGAVTHGANGHDMVFGNRDNKNKRQRQNDSNTGSTNLPESDDAKDHNSYFGMAYSVDFTIDPGYVGPLEYWFYGDDDMWVFLSELDDDGNIINSTTKQIVDIGGVHSSIGTYANLWDYMSPISNSESDTKKYRLSLFYTERGASGSSCYMRFTLPLDSYTSDAPEQDDAIVIEKAVLDADGNAVPYDKGDGTEFSFLLKMQNADGISFEDIYDYVKYTSDASHLDTGSIHEFGTIGDETNVNGEYMFTLKSGERIAITGLPQNTYYTVRELNGEDYVTAFLTGSHAHDGDAEIDTTEGLPQIKHLEDGSVGTPKALSADTENYVKFVNAGAYKYAIKDENGSVKAAGEELTYEIEWSEHSNEDEDVTITDILDPGVDFVGAKVGRQDDTSYQWWDGTGTYSDADGSTITYDKDSHTVKWVLRNRYGKEEGFVSVKVRINGDAVPPEFELGSVHNSASVKVGNRAEIDTNTEGTDVWQPQKTETAPGSGKPVKKGDEITYRITWKNYLEEAAAVTVRDPLDPGLTYKEGSAKAYRGGTVIGTGIYDSSTRTLKWNLGTQAPGAEGYVEFTATVNNSAAQKWYPSILTEDGTESGPTVFNRGYVKVGTRAESYTDVMENPVPSPVKEETVPGTEKLLGLGDEVTYDISWWNYAREDDGQTPKEATVVIRDTLDPGIDFEEASFGELTLKKEAGSVNGSVDGREVSISFEDGTVTWTIQAAPGQSGTVSLKGSINENAVFVPGTENRDYEVSNTASVTVDDDPSVDTESVRNPVTDKEETKPGAGVLTGPGNQITYKIHWENPHARNADVVVTDVLDAGVNFVSASDGYEYDPDTHTVTWTLKARTPGEKGEAELTVEVNEDAAMTWNYATDSTGADKGVPGTSMDDRIVNRASVQVGNDPAVRTGILENPVPEPTFTPVKTEISPGEGSVVGQGQEIVYTISYKNLNSWTSTVAVTDVLDDGVEFVSASDNGTYDSGTNMVTWILAGCPAKAEGTVTLIVRVRDTGSDVANKASVMPGNSTYVESNTVTNPTKTPGSSSPELVIRKAQEAAPDRHYSGVTERELSVIGEDTITYYLTVTNVGGAAAEHVTVTDTVPDGLTLAVEDGAYAISAGGYSTDGVHITWDVGSLQAAGSGDNVRKVWFKTVVPVSEKADRWVNTGYVTYDGNPGAPVPSNEVAAVTDPGELSISKEVTNAAFTHDEREFTFSVELTGPDGNPLEAAVEYTGAKEGTIENGKGQVSLKHGESVTLHGIPAGTTYHVEEILDGDDYVLAGDGVMSGTIGSGIQSSALFENTYVSPNIEIEKLQSADGKPRTKEIQQVEDGSVVTYIILVRNTGAGPAEGVTVTDTVPDGLELVPGSVKAGGLEDGSGRITWEIGHMEAGEERELEFQVSVPAMYASAFWLNTAYVHYDNPPEGSGAPDPGEDVPSNRVEIRETTARLVISKRISDPYGTSSAGSFRFTIHLYDAAGEPLTGEYSCLERADLKVSDGSTFELMDGESITIYGLPDQAAYTVAEDDLALYTEGVATEDGRVEERLSETGTAVSGTTASVQFVNTYTPQSASVSLDALKQVSLLKPGGIPFEIEAGQFHFVITPHQENPAGDPIAALPDRQKLVTNDASGRIKLFDGEQFTAPGSYQYSIYELPQDEEIEGMWYDPTVYAVTVEVTDTDGVLYAQVLIDGEPASTLIFGNKYEEPDWEEAAAEIGGRKVLDGRTMDGGEFMFRLEPVSYEPPVQPATGQTEGSNGEALTCSYTPHVHTQDCYDAAGTLICGYADYVIHTHDSMCYDSYGELICSLPEIQLHTHSDGCWPDAAETILDEGTHVHTDACYEEVGICGLEEGPGHTHTDECYTIVTEGPVCGLEETPAHTHDNSCYTRVQGDLICGQEESPAHTHGPDCYVRVRGDLICTLAEDDTHTHTDECYAYTDELVCTLAETAGHTHTESCYAYTDMLTCGLEETAGHTHTDDCYIQTEMLSCGLEEVPAHTHTDDCFEKVLTCGQAEGLADNTDPQETGQPVCGQQDVLHTHTEDCFDDGRLICGMTEIREHQHDSSCFGDDVTSEEETIPGGTEIQEDPDGSGLTLTSNNQTSPLAMPVPETDTVWNRADGTFSFGVMAFSEPGVYTYRITEVVEDKSGYTYDRTVYTVKVHVVLDEGLRRLFASVEIVDAAEAVFRNIYTPPQLRIYKEQALNEAGAVKDRLTVQMGDTLTYYITVENTGVTDATNVSVTDQIPEGLTLITDAGTISDGGVATGGIITWNLGTLHAGETRTVWFKVTVPGANAYREWKNVAELSYAEGNNIPSNEVEAEEYPEKPETKKEEVSPGEGSPVTAGEEITYAISHKNVNLEDPWVSLTFVDTLDRGVDYIPDSSALSLGGVDSALEPSINGRTLTWQVTGVLPGQVAKITFRVQVNVHAAGNGVVANDAVVRERTNRYVTNEVTNPVDSPEDRGPSIHKTSVPASGTATDPAVVHEGGTITYTLAVKNRQRDIEIHDVKVEDTIPDGLEIDLAGILVHFGDASAAVPVTESLRAGFSADGQTVRFTIYMLQAQETAYFLIPCKITVDSGEFVNTAKITSSDGTDLDVSSETTYHELVPEGLTIRKAGFGGIAIPGALLQLKDETGTTLYTWESTGKAQTFTVDPGTYTLHELLAPDGYLLAEDITITVQGDGMILVNGVQAQDVTMVDDWTKVSILKTDVDGETGLDGALLALYKTEDMDGTEPKAGAVPVDTWVSEADRAHEMNAVLAAGKSYTLVEQEAPDGYMIAEPVEFTVEEDGMPQEVTMADPRTPGSLSVAKECRGGMADLNYEFHFALKLDGWDGGLPDTLTYTKNGEPLEAELGSDGTYAFTLSHMDTVLFEDIPYGVTYEVTELDGETNGYDVEMENAEGTIGSDEIQIRCVNTKDAVVPTGVWTGMRTSFAVALFGLAAMILKLLAVYLLKKE